MTRAGPKSRSRVAARPKSTGRAEPRRAGADVSPLVADEVECKRLLLNGLAGDSAAHRELLDRLTLLLRRYYRSRLLRIGRDAADADDLIQDVLVIVDTRRHMYDPDERLMPWIHTIARHKFIDYLRRTKSFLVNVPLDQVELTGREDHTGVESAHDVQRLMQILPAKMRSAIQCVKLDGLSAAEAATRCGASESAIRLNVHRGLKRLAESVAQERERKT